MQTLVPPRRPLAGHPFPRRRLQGAISGPVLAAVGLIAAAVLAFPSDARAQEALTIRAVGEKRAAQLPAGPLYWRVETFPTVAAARAAEGPASLAAEIADRAWLVTLAPRGGATPGATRVAEVGPLPAVRASEYLLRLNEASGPPGSVTPVHTHPGSEAFYVLAGEQSIRTPNGVIRIPAGRSEAGPGGGTPLSVSSTGSTDLLALVMFVVDAGQAFSSPAAFPPTLPAALPRTGAVPPAAHVVWLSAAGVSCVSLGLATRRQRRTAQ